ncbi:MAG: hypothetical protein A3J94_09325 [Syntrophus sp. RIFOXYC2_FULL_54_9]|nr:MAG: hypothetical protein A3J94_09325 [Syntrophus sp. RIFOXYC2_FULL_54_9]
MMMIVRAMIPFFEPLPLSLALLIAGLVLLILKRRKAAIVVTGTGIGILLVFGYGVFTKPVLYSLERSYPPLIVEQITPKIRNQIRHVVVLGSGHVSDPDLPKTAQISGSSLFRLVEGVRLYRLLPGSRLVITGGVIPDPVTNARVVSDVARQIGIPVRDMIVEERPSDTVEEARLLKGLLGGTPFVLVTSAAHMKRAVTVFRGFGMQPVPAPTDFIIKNRPGGAIDSWLPNCGNLWISQRVIYEWLGELWAWMKK